MDGHDPSEQWNRKKQTKEEKRAAKKAKLDPGNWKSALDVVKEREAEALKRKRGDDDGDDEGGVVGEGEGEGLEDAGNKRLKSEADADTAEAKRRKKREKRREKRERKAEKKARVEARKARRQDRDLEEAQAEKQAEVGNDVDLDAFEQTQDIDVFDASGLADAGEDKTEDEIGGAASDASSAPTTPMVDSPAFDLATNHSGVSSPSSIIPPSHTDQPPEQSQPEQLSEKPAADTTTTSSTPSTKPAESGTDSPKISIPKVTHAEAQERIRARIEALRAQRKADSTTVPQSRQELLEQRRKKEEQRKAAKKAQRQKEKEEEQRRRDEQLRGSGSPLSSVVDIFSPRQRSPQKKEEGSYSFSRLAFDDGTAADANLTHLQDPQKKKRKGPQDPQTALRAAQSKESRLAGYDPAKRADVAEKDMWLNARKRAHGERVRDDSSLLKKALKRKEKQKGKSEVAWREREEKVVKGREMRQKKREANLQKRKEEKGGGKKKKKGKGGKGGKGGGKGSGKKKGRPGFEGRFKA